jgi:hypothetical protein
MTFFGRVRRRRSQKVRVRLCEACRGEALGEDGSVVKLNSKEAA